MALGGFVDRARRVIVQFSSPDPKTGEQGTKCTIEVRLLPHTVRAEDVDADLYLAADKAADRLKRAVSRALAHERAWHELPQKPTLPVVKPGRRTSRR